MVDTVIKSLVLQGKRVIIPNFGAFLIKDSNLHPVLSKENLTFSPFLRYNDGFLEGEVAHYSGIHKDEAGIQVADYVKGLQAAIIDRNEIVVIQDFGCFYKDTRGNIVFSLEIPRVEMPKVAPLIATPEPAVDSTLNVSELSVEHEEQSELSIDPFAEEPNLDCPAASNGVLVNEDDIKIEVSPLVDGAMLEFEPADVEEDEKPIQIAHKNNTPPTKLFSKGMLVSFLLLLFSLLALNVFWNDIFGVKTDSQRPRIVLDPIDDATVKEEMQVVDQKHKVQDAIDAEVVSSIEKSVADEKPKVKAEPKQERKAEPKAAEKQVAKKEEPTPAKKAVNSPPIEVSNAYVLVLGSFGTEENAQKRVLELSRKSVKAKVVVRNKMNSVISGNFESYEDAQKEQARLKGLGVDGWISRK